MNYMDYGGGDH